MFPNPSIYPSLLSAFGVGFEFNEGNQEPSFNFPRDVRYTFSITENFCHTIALKIEKKSRRSQIDRWRNNKVGDMKLLEVSNEFI